MAQIEHLPRNTGISPLGERYLDILINRYKGRVPWGEKTKIAEELGCSLSALSQFDHGYYPAWTQERDRRLRELSSLADPVTHIIELQNLYENAIKERKRRGMPLTSKDPLDILTEMRKATFGNRSDSGTQSQSVNATVFNFEGLSDKALSDAIEQVTQRLRDGGFDDLGNIIDGQFSGIGGPEVAATSTGSGTKRLVGGESTEGANQGQESS